MASNIFLLYIFVSDFCCFCLPCVLLDLNIFSSNNSLIFICHGNVVTLPLLSLCRWENARYCTHWQNLPRDYDRKCYHKRTGKSFLLSTVLTSHLHLSFTFEYSVVLCSWLIRKEYLQATSKMKDRKFFYERVFPLFPDCWYWVETMILWWTCCSCWCFQACVLDDYHSIFYFVEYPDVCIYSYFLDWLPT